ncbi:MAG: hypothetical protein K2N84_00225 [Clostridia bacterium]|nr:hypothetical protein [Clostridia bacterium]
MKRKEPKERKPINRKSLRWKFMSTKNKIRTIIRESNREAQQRAWEKLWAAIQEMEKDKQSAQTPDEENKEPPQTPDDENKE